MLIYPRRAAFDAPLQVFEFTPQLKLWVLPFDLEQGVLLGGIRFRFNLSSNRKPVLSRFDRRLSQRLVYQKMYSLGELPNQWRWHMSELVQVNMHEAKIQAIPAR